MTAKKEYNMYITHKICHSMIDSRKYLFVMTIKGKENGNLQK